MGMLSWMAVCVGVTFFLPSTQGNQNVTMMIGSDFKFEFYSSFFERFYKCLCNSTMESCQAFYSKPNGTFKTNIGFISAPKSPSRFYTCLQLSYSFGGGILCAKSKDTHTNKENYTMVTLIDKADVCDLSCVGLTGIYERKVHINATHKIKQCDSEGDSNSKTVTASTTAMISGVVATFIVVLIIVTVVSCLCWRRKKLGRNISLHNAPNTSNQGDISENLQMIEYQTENVIYEGAQKTTPMLTATHNSTINKEQQDNGSDSYTYTTVNSGGSKKATQAMHSGSTSSSSSTVKDDDELRYAITTSHTSEAKGIYSRLHETKRNKENTYNVLDDP